MTAVDRPDNGQDEMVWVQLPADDVAFIAGFDPDRDRTASRADMVRVVEHLQAALASGRAGAGEQQREQVAAELARHQHLMGRRDDDQPQWFSWCECGWEGGPVEPSRGAPADVRLAFRLHVAGELLGLLGGPQPDGEAVELAAQIVENAMGIGSVSDEQLAQVAESIRQIPSYLARADREGGEPCPVYSHGDSGWHCAVTGDHDQHTNAARDETW